MKKTGRTGSEAASHEQGAPLASPPARAPSPPSLPPSPDPGLGFHPPPPPSPAPPPPLLLRTSLLRAAAAPIVSCLALSCDAPRQPPPPSPATAPPRAGRRRPRPQQRRPAPAAAARNSDVHPRAGRACPLLRCPVPAAARRRVRCQPASRPAPRCCSTAPTSSEGCSLPGLGRLPNRGRHEVACSVSSTRVRSRRVQEEERRHPHGCSRKYTKLSESVTQFINGNRDSNLIMYNSFNVIKDHGGRWILHLVVD